MKRVNGKNQKGSVLLAVVCFGMMCVTMATVCLSLVNYSNGATAKNVMRTQAKVTAEACLTEYIGAYTGDVDPAVDSVNGGKPKYTYLQNLAAGYTEAAPRVIKVNSADANFVKNYGEAEIRLYEDGAGGFRVKCVCTVGKGGYLKAQTQSASVKFASASASPQITSDALECSEGFSDTGGRQANISGDMHIERRVIPGSSPVAYEPDTVLTVGVNGGTYNSHIYSENSIQLSNGGTFTDVYNKTGTLNYQPNKDNNVGDAFVQAPVIWTDQYLLATDNNAGVGTKVGKTDTHLYNSWTAAKAGKTYDAAHLENMDGFIYVGKQVMFIGPSGANLFIGYTSDSGGTMSKPIDLYCGGAYFGQINSHVLSGGTQSVNGQFQAARGVKFPQGVAQTGGTAVTNADGTIKGGGGAKDYTINGNVYCYDNGETASNPYSTSGSLYWFSTETGKTIHITGDLTVEHDIFMTSGNTIKVDGSVHIGGKVYIISRGTWNSMKRVMVVDPAKVAEIEVATTPKKISYSSHNYVTAGVKVDTVVDKTGVTSSPRDAIPLKGYQASTGVRTDNRSKLRNIYKNATTNKIFDASFNGSSSYHSYAKDISLKYAEAMATKMSESNKYKDKHTGDVKSVLTKHTGNGSTVYEIGTSCYMVPSDIQEPGNNADDEAKNKRYVVKLVQDDIVLALPIQNGDKGSPLIFVDATERVVDAVSKKGPFLYIMYYYAGSGSVTRNGSTGDVTINNCLYLSEDAGRPDGFHKVQNVYVNGSFQEVTVNMKNSTKDFRTNTCPDIRLGRTDYGRTWISDVDLYTPYEVSVEIHEDTISKTYFVDPDLIAPNIANVNDPSELGGSGDTYTDPNTGSSVTRIRSQFYQNLIINMVPDDVDYYFQGTDTRAQGILYAPASNVVFTSAQIMWYGQVKCKTFTVQGEVSNPVITDIPAAAGSILDFINISNTSATGIQIQYYEY